MARRSRKQNSLLSLIVLLLSFVIWYGQGHGWFAAAETNQPGLYTVTRYVDGDTIDVDMNGKTETLRFVGVDTRRPTSPTRPCNVTARKRRPIRSSLSALRAAKSD